VFAPAILALLTAGAPPNVIDLYQRTPIAVLIVAPSGDIAGVPVAEAQDVIRRALTENTDLDPSFPDATDAIEGCAGRIGCVVPQIRSDFDRQKYLGQSYERYLERADSMGYPRFLAILSGIGGPKARLSAVLVDTDVALAEWHIASREGPWQDELERQVARLAVRDRPPWVELESADAARRALGSLFERRFRPVFESTQHWAPYGTVAFEIDDTLDVIVDGRVVGSTVIGTNELRGLRIGSRALALRNGEETVWRREVAVISGETISVTPSLSLTTEGAVRVATLWSGVALAVAGAALTGYAVYQQNDAAPRVCVAPAGTMGCDKGATFRTLSSDPGDSQGVLTAPLGYSLVGAGAAWSVGAVLTDSDEVPWIPIVVGVVAGGLAYGISAALNGDIVQ